MIPEIAIIEKNTLTALGLQTILEELIPQAVIRVFHSFEAHTGRVDTAGCHTRVPLVRISDRRYS